MRRVADLSEVARPQSTRRVVGRSGPPCQGENPGLAMAAALAKAKVPHIDLGGPSLEERAEALRAVADRTDWTEIGSDWWCRWTGALLYVDGSNRDGVWRLAIPQVEGHPQFENPKDAKAAYKRWLRAGGGPGVPWRRG